MRTTVPMVHFFFQFALPQYHERDQIEDAKIFYSFALPPFLSRFQFFGGYK